VLQRGALYTLGVEWLGAEGSSLVAFTSNDANRFTQLVKEYWYRAPL